MELFQVSLIGFQKFFLFWVAGMILEAWDVESESAHSSMFQFCLQAVWASSAKLSVIRLIYVMSHLGQDVCVDMYLNGSYS